MISNIIDRRKTKYISNLKYEEGIAATTALMLFTTDIADQVLQEKEILRNAYNDLWEQTKHRQQLYLHDLQVNPDKYGDILEKSRRYGVGGKGGRRNFEFLLAQKGGNEATKVLGYTAEQNGNPEWQGWNDEQWKQLNQNKWPQHNLAPGHSENIDGHHNINVNNPNLSPEEAIINASNPDGITPVAHRTHIKFSHGDNTQIPTNRIVTDVTDKHEQIQELKTDKIEKYNEIGNVVAISVGLLAGTMSAIIKYRQISKSPLPWNKAKTVAIVGSFAYGTTTGILPFVAVKAIREPLNNLIEEELGNLFAGGMDIAQDSLLDNVGDALGDSSIIFLAISIRTAFSFFKDSQEIGFRKSFSSSVERLRIVALEQATFALIDILIDSVTPIPDPTINVIVTSLRVTYSLGKILKNREHQNNLYRKRISYIEEAAYSSLVL